MKKRNILSILLTMIMVCTLFLGVQSDVKASDGSECIDGSYLTNDDSSEATVGSMTRGIYLKSGSSTITKAGAGKIAVGGNTVAQKTVDKVALTVIVERLVNGKWLSYSSWSTTKYNTVYVSSSKTLTVPTGYYYRVCCIHHANSDVSDSYTNGIYI